MSSLGSLNILLSLDSIQFNLIWRLINRSTKAKPPQLSNFMPFYQENMVENDDNDGALEYLANR